MFYPTKTGLSLIGLSFFLYLVSLQSRSGLLFLILGILAGCFLLNLIEARRATKVLKLTPPASLYCREGETLEGAWQIENSSKRGAGLAELIVPRSLTGWLREKVRAYRSQRFGETPPLRGVVLRIGAVPPGQEVTLTPELVMPRRGVYPFAGLRLVSSYPFGLVCWERPLPLAGEIVVFPAAYPCPAPTAAGFEPMVGGKYVGKNRSAAGDSFRGVRPIEPRDPLKMIHWASSSKGQGLMVKEFDEELSGRVALIMDADGIPAPDGAPLLDWSARAVASLMFEALDDGHQVEFAGLGDPEVHSVPPFADGEVVLDALARVEPGQGTLTRAALEQVYRALPRRAALCFVLSHLNDDFLAFLEADPLAEQRQVTVCLPNGPAESQRPLPQVAFRYYAAKSMTLA